MYIVFGNKIVDSKEMKEIIETHTQFKVVKDMSKGTKREDIVAFNLSIDINALNEQMAENELIESDPFEQYLSVAEKIAMGIAEYVPKEAMVESRAYKWDQSDNDIKLIVAIAHEEVGELKLMDIMKRLATQVE